MREFKIKNRVIGPGHPCYVIAEMSANHAGSFEKALAIVRSAKEAGADAIKLQTYTPDTMTIDCSNKYFQLDHPLWKNKTLYELYKEAQTPWEWHLPLKIEAEKIGLHFFSSPFDETAVDFLEILDVPAYKIASFELIDDALLKKVAQTKKPVIMSTGMAALQEIQHAVEVLRQNGNKDLALLRCVSAYPAEPEGMNLALIMDMRQQFNVVTGLSDHTTNSVSSIAAVALGANIIEKHFKVSAADQSHDAVFSLSLEQFRNLVHDIRLAESSIGRVSYGPVSSENDSLKFRRSLFFVKDMQQGEVITPNSVRVIRPGHGLAPKEIGKVLGKRLKKAIGRGVPVTMDIIDE
jgi:pseudaminic acid synthase